ncbi:MAG: hypothetical protein HQ526_05110 [Actinobacteria bacterium]|nr:hypothetical protein [Actinomycetota bacterium]
MAALALALAATVSFAACSSDSATDGAGEIFLAPASENGPDPFTQSVVNEDVALTSESSASPTPQASGETASAVGTDPRVYAGSGTLPSCDKQKLISALNADPAAAAAWAGVINISTDEIRQYVDEAAAVVLRTDTRVTNYTLSGSTATPFQYVLESGTAVLVDSAGFPRVRCACGNPLTPAVAVSATPTFTGTQWSGFNPDALTVITPGPVVVNLTVVGITNGADTLVPVGPQTAAPTSSPTPPVSPSATSGEPTSAGYTSCAKRYGELVRDLTLAGGIPANERQRWADQAKDAAQFARDGNLSRATEICEQTVTEMEQALGE